MRADSRYKVPKFEKGINRLIGFVFYWRLLSVSISFITLLVLSFISYVNSTGDDKLKNFALILTCGSIIIGIFYSLINYEHNQLKFKHDVQSSKEMLTYSTASKMHGQELMMHFQRLKLFYNDYKHLFTSLNWKEIESFWKANPETRLSFIIVFNYFECISIGVEQSIMDEVFLKEFFKTLFKDYLIKYGTYIEQMRVENNTSRIYNHFTKIAGKWKNED